MSSAAIAVVEGALSELREQRTLIVDELRKIDKLIDGQVKALDQVKPKPKSASKSGVKPNANSASGGTVTSLAAKRARKSSAAPSKGGRPTKKSEFMKWLRENKAIERERIPQQLNTSVQKTNEFVPELVREGLVKLEDRGDKHDPTEFVIITEAGLKA